MDTNGEEPRANPSSNGEPDHAQSPQNEADKEGRFLLGPPTFTEFANGRLRCLETGHELKSNEKDSYITSKGCRRALVEHFLSMNKPPLNMFKPSPLSKSKLVCKLTGDTINKTEEHIWKHINGRRFLNKLEQKEVEKMAPVEEMEKNVAKSSKVKVKKAKKEDANSEEKKDVDENGSLGKEDERSSDSEEPDFWVPPVGSRWDLDDGRDRWDSCASQGDEKDEDPDLVDEKAESKSVELSVRTKRMSIAMGPSSFASRKKKIKTIPISADDN